MNDNRGAQWLFMIIISLSLIIFELINIGSGNLYLGRNAFATVR